VGKLQIPIVRIPRNSPLTIDEGLETTNLQNTEETQTTLHHIHLIGKLTAIQRNFLFQGIVKGIFKGPCDRCIEPAKVEESVEVSWLFEPGNAPDAMEDFAQSEDAEEEKEYKETEQTEQLRYYDGDELDLAAHAQEEMVLASPLKLYCDHTCKGLCQQCGVNLNHAACECTEETEQNNPGLKALKDLYPDLPSNTSEE